MKEPSKKTAPLARRDFFARTGDGLLGVALAQLLGRDFFAGPAQAAEALPNNLAWRQGHHPAKATSVIQLFMNGGPSQMDLFDPKPVLDRMDGKPYPGNVEEIGNQDTTSIGVMMGGQYPMARHGQSGQWMADVLPHTAEMVDELCFVHSMWTDHPNHDIRVVAHTPV